MKTILGRHLNAVNLGVFRIKVAQQFRRHNINIPEANIMRRWQSIYKSVNGFVQTVVAAIINQN